MQIHRKTNINLYHVYDIKLTGFAAYYYTKHTQKNTNINLLKLKALQYFTLYINEFMSH